MKYTVTGMKVSLDINIWIFGLFDENIFCERILESLTQFDVILPNQIRDELERNLPEAYLKRFYRIVYKTEVYLNYEQVPQSYVTMFEEKGLKKGDVIIGGFCEWQKIDVIVSDNRDFLRGLSASHYFEVLSPQEFCTKFSL